MGKIRMYAANGEAYDLYALKLELLKGQGNYCPVTVELIDLNECEILYINDKDWVISDYGIQKLREMYGDDFIDERLVNDVLVDDDAEDPLKLY